MKTLRISPDGTGAPRLHALELPFITSGPTATDDDRQRMPAPELARAVRSLRAVYASDATALETSATGRRLTIVISGAVEVGVPHLRAQLRPGDVLFSDVPGNGVALRAIGDTRLIEVDVTDDWIPAGTVPPAIDDGDRGPRDRPGLSEMYVREGRANLRDLDRLFPAEPGSSAEQPVLAMTFMCLSPGLFGDWHTEQAISLVIGLAGGFELEVGGEGGRRVLRAGDLCLVRDDEGQGHVSRTHGETRFVQLVLPTDHRWA